MCQTWPPRRPILGREGALLPDERSSHRGPSESVWADSFIVDLRAGRGAISSSWRVDVCSNHDTFLSAAGFLDPSRLLFSVLMGRGKVQGMKREPSLGSLVWPYRFRRRARSFPISGIRLSGSPSIASRRWCCASCSPACAGGHIICVEKDVGIWAPPPGGGSHHCGSSSETL